MAKDPAFLFYSKDWIEGTAELLPDEKGVYIDLLCYQHQRGDLPNDTKRLARMVGMSVDEFEKIWSVIGCKFEANGERTLNRKLSEVMGERKEKGHRNKIIGVFGSLCRKSELSYMDLRSIRSQFKVADFENLDSERISERLSEWFNERLALLGNGDVNANADVNSISNGVEKKFFDNQKLNDVFCRWLKMLNERGKPMTQSSIEQLQMKMNYQNDDISIKQIEQSLENGWLTLRPVESTEKPKPEPKKYRMPL